MSSRSNPFSEEVPTLLREHLDHLRASGISVEVIKDRGYESVLGEKKLADAGFSKVQQRPIGILMPGHGVDEGELSPQYRPDHPRKDSRGRSVKYETPAGARSRLDVPPRCRPSLADPRVDLYFTEGAKKADVIATVGGCAINMGGVWNFKQKNIYGGVTLSTDFDFIAWKGSQGPRTVILAYDSDLITKNSA